MRKGLVFAIFMLFSLPSCKKNKKKSKKQIHAKVENIDLFSSVNIPLTENTDENFFENNNEVLSFFDEEIEEFADHKNSEIIVAQDDMTTSDVKSLDEFSWVEAASEVDEEFKTVYFEFDQHDVRADQLASIDYDITQIKEELKVAEKSGIQPTVVISGHACHSAGSSSYNLAKSEKRAKQVADIFSQSGISRDIIKVVGRGQEIPAVIDGKTITGSRIEQAPNRRVEVSVIYS